MFEKLVAWAHAHPTIMLVIVWPALTAVLTLLFKPRSAEEYAELAKTWPRLAAFWRFLGAVGLDIPKAMQSLQEIFKPRGPMVALLAFGFVIATSACTPNQKRALQEYWTDKADCAIRNMNLPNEEIIKRCAVDANDVDQILRIIAGAREEAARESALAAARQLEEDMRRARAAGCGVQ